MAQGYVGMYPNLFELADLGKVCAVTRKNMSDDKVTLVIGGGSGNEPWLIGHVGEGLADAAVLGYVYVAPPAKSILRLSRQLPHSKGILYIATRHTGDVLNFELVRDLCALEGIQTRAVYLSDDISTADADHRSERRGIAGIALFVKLLGAAAQSGCNLDELVALADDINRSIATYSVTTSTGYMPGTNKAMCELPDGEIEFGMGFNGEPGNLHSKLMTADEIVDTMMKPLCADLSLDKSQDPVVIFLNGFGFTSNLELCIAARRIKEYASQDGINVYDIFMDNLLCPQGTGGFSITLLKLSEAMTNFYDSRCYSPMYYRPEKAKR